MSDASWDGPCDPLGDLRKVCRQIEENSYGLGEPMGRSDFLHLLKMDLGPDEWAEFVKSGGMHCPKCGGQHAGPDCIRSEVNK